MPVIVVAPNNELLEKLKSNIEEVRARGGVLYVFADQDAGFTSSDNMHIIEMPHVEEVIAPIFYTVPLQLLSYHVALIKGTDVDQPRNLAKSVTVEYPSGSTSGWSFFLSFLRTFSPAFSASFYDNLSSSAIFSVSQKENLSEINLSHSCLTC